MLRLTTAVIASLALAGCSTMDAMSTSAKGSGKGVQAVMKRPGAASDTGAADVRFADRGDGVLMTVSVTNLLPGVYRLAIHETPNCTSPNLFSAGPVWAPPGVPVEQVAPVFYTNSEGDGMLAVEIHGVHTTGPDGLQGHSVVLHQGNRLQDAVPGVPNDRVLCGVIGPLVSFGL